METKELTVEETEQGTTSTVETGGDVAIASACVGTENATGSRATEQPADLIATPQTLPTLEGLWQLTLDWQPTALQQAQFQQLYTLILAGNHQFNLTRITEPTEFWEKHLWDSLVGLKAFLQAVSGQQSAVSGQQLASSQQQSAVSSQHTAERKQATAVSGQLGPEGRADADPSPISKMSFKAIDIGTGAGFPGLPVAIAQPTWAVTLLDSTRKKMTFLDHVLATMGLANAITLAERVEQVGRQKHQRQAYDLALIRAVATATVCAEYALPLLNIGGCAVLYRGQWTTDEMTALEGAAAQLGGAIEAVEPFTTPLTHSVRHCIVLKKVAPTPTAFPRAVGVPTQNPL